MKTSPLGPLLPAVHDDNLMIFYSEIKDGLEKTNYITLHLVLHIKLEKAPAEHLE